MLVIFHKKKPTIYMLQKKNCMHHTLHFFPFLYVYFVRIGWWNGLNIVLGEEGRYLPLRCIHIYMNVVNSDRMQSQVWSTQITMLLLSEHIFQISLLKNHYQPPSTILIKICSIKGIVREAKQWQNEEWLMKISNYSVSNRWAGTKNSVINNSEGGIRL